MSPFRHANHVQRTVVLLAALVTLAAFALAAAPPSAVAPKPTASPAPEAKPAAAKPAEAKPMPKPAEAKPVEPKPAEAAASDTPLVPDQVRQLMQDGKYAEAAVAIDEAAKAKDAPVDYLTYLKGRALYLDKKYDEAAAQFDALQKQSPKSPWLRHARFGKAVALARKGDFRAAELIYRAEAEYLLSVDRKQEIAAIYLEFADNYFKPPKEQQKPDYAKALEFYKKALDVGPKPEKRTEVELLVAQCHQELKQLDKAIPLYEKFIKDHADSPLDVEARYRLGESQLAAGQAKPARRSWQDLLAKYPDSRSERIAEAAYKLSRTWGIPPVAAGPVPQANNNANPFDQSPAQQAPVQQMAQPMPQQGNPTTPPPVVVPGTEGLNLGVAALESFIEKFPQHKLASQAHLDIARSFVAFGRYEDAVKALDRFLKDPRYKDREESPEAQSLLGQSYQLQKKYPEALTTWHDYLGKYPTHKAWSAVQRQIVDTEYMMAVEKEQDKDYAAAVKLYGEFLVKYPLDSRSPQILFEFGWMNHQQKKWDAAIADWQRLVSKYSRTEPASRAQYMVAETMEKELGKLEEALEQYRKVTWGGHLSAARTAIARLEAKTMTIETERAFRSDETPRIKLATRNIESVTVRAYKVDMETYFRKMHLARGVESLDIALIDPDKTFEFKVPKYAKHQELTSQIEVPLPAGAKAGVMAVTVSSKTLEATTMVVQSDLDVIVKSSRDEVFVFAQNMRTGKPWPGARLLVSNGQKVFAEVATGPDGVYQGSAGAPKAGPDELKTAEDVRVFAIADGNVGSNIVSLSGVGVAQGLSDKGYIYTDRPAYRAGQMVHVRGCIRTVPGAAAGAAAAALAPRAEDLPQTVAPMVENAQPTFPNPPPSLQLQPNPPPSLPVQPNPPPSPYMPPNVSPGVPGAPPAAMPLPAPAPAPATVPRTPQPRPDLAPDGPGPAPAAIRPRSSNVEVRKSEPGRVGPEEPGRHAPAPKDATAIASPKVQKPAPGPAAAPPPAADEYVIEAGKKYTLEVFDGRNRLVRQEEVALGRFGTFHVAFVLPSTSPQGQYRVLVRDKAGHSYQGTFLVHEYQLEPVRLVVDTPRRVYYRGEEIEGTIRAEFYYGAPLAGREIRYQLADERAYTATTDAKGEVRFKLPTREFSETQVLPLVVTLPERNLQTGVQFFLSAQGFSINLETIRQVYVAGETFEVSLKATDAEGKPVAQKLVLNVLEKTKLPNGSTGERLVGKPQELATAEKDGIARATLKLEDGGRYVLRAEGIDRFKNPITGECPVRVSDDKDEVRLRVLADKHTFKVGDTAAVQLHWREDPALALVTYQGARILGYRLVELKTGPNPLDIPMTARLAPNFELAVAVMTDIRGGDAQPLAASPPKRRFHTASSPFVVERDLRVKIETKRKGDAKGPVQPGEEIEVSVTTTDPQGKPVAAELSLAMVEQSLLDRFSWQVAAIQDFFRGQMRQAAVRTTSSITFNYRPATRPIDRHLLAEEERLEIAKEEAASRVVALGRIATETPVMPAPAVTAGEGRDVEIVEEESEELAQQLDDMGGAANMPGMDPFAPGNAGAARRNQAEWGLLTQSRSRMLRQGGGAMGGQQAGQSDEAQTYSFSMGLPRGGVNVGGGEQDEQTSGLYYNRAYGRRGTLPSSLRFGYKLHGKMSTAGGHYYVAPNANDLRQWAAEKPQSGLAYMDRNGTLQNLVLLSDGTLDQKTADALAAELNKAGAVLLPGLGPQETGYWNPSVVTGEDGKATVKFAVPERSTAWQLLAKGITVETLAGEGTDKLTVKKDLFGELKLPPAFTEGDEAEIGVTVHNDAVEKGPIEVVLRTTIGDRSVEEKKTLDAAAKGIHELSFKTVLKRPDAKDGKPLAASPGAEAAVSFELTVTAGEGEKGEKSEKSEKGVKRDVVRQAVPLKPYGMAVFATASGTATSDTTAWVEPPKEMPFESPSLQILIGPTVQQSLLDIVLGPAPWCQLESSRIASGLETTTSDLMASLGLQKLIGTSREAGSPQAQALDARVRSSIGGLISSQNDDGGWSWTGRGGASNRYSTARAAWALSLARSAGYTVSEEPFNKALGYLRSQVAATSDSDYESKAILLHALSAAGQGDFALANRLYRNRPALSNAALAHLALAFVEMDRKATAAELLALLGERKLDEPVTRRAAEKGVLPWNHGPAELRALYALALQKVSPKEPKAKAEIDWLLAHRTGHRWMPDKATGPAALALTQWFAENRFQSEHYKLSLFVNDVQAAVLDIDQNSGTQTIDVPAASLKPGKQRINFQITGRGQYSYQCILGGFVAADKVKSTTSDWEVKRIYEPAPLEFDGKEVPRGFGVLSGSFTTFRNPLTQLPVGRRGYVDLEIWRQNLPANTPEDQLEYLVVTEPLPSGATVIEKSVRGGFERFEVSPGAITFYVGNRRHPGTIHYELSGYLPGKYRAAPTVIRDAYRPEKLAASEPKPLDVLAFGSQSADKYRLTPQELFELGKLHFAKKDQENLKAAGGHLSGLLTEWKNLNDETYKGSIQMLLDVHLELGPPASVVRYFEIIKEKWPAEEIPFDKIVKVGAAYHEMGEYERSYLVFRATVESSFSRESGVAGFLQSQGEFLRSVAVMGRLLREYPPEPYAAAAGYALAQQVYAKAPEAAADEKLRQQKVNRVDLVRRAWAMLEGFLTAYPDDPAADQAAFAGANALLELKAYQQATDSCNRYAVRYPKSDLLDSYWYIIGYCDFATGKHEAALEMCRKVAEATRINKTTGQVEESPNKHRAIYILGQVYHSLGQAAAAIREYGRVADRFADAKEAIDYFVRKAIALPEVTMVKPGEPAEVELKFRNVAACDTKVYRIDLMKFSLLKQSLGGITNINLSGIRPYHETTTALGDGQDYRDRTHKLALPLKEEGAYLVVCRGENLYASGLVLVTPLAVEVQEEAASGRVRTTVKDRGAEKYLSDVHVKVIGSRNGEFISGATDLRGVFVADGVLGRSTVIAQATPSRYAFFRGQAELGPVKPSLPAPNAQPAPDAKSPGRGKAANESELLEGLQKANTMNQKLQVDQLKQIYERQEKGVKAKAAF
jgi:tetratricopeptide (TPR) repeat protein